MNRKGLNEAIMLSALPGLRRCYFSPTDDYNRYSLAQFMAETVITMNAKLNELRNKYAGNKDLSHYLKNISVMHAACSLLYAVITGDDADSIEINPPHIQSIGGDQLMCGAMAILMCEVCDKEIQNIREDLAYNVETAQRNAAQR